MSCPQPIRILAVTLALAATCRAEPRAALTPRGELLVDGKPFLPIIVWAQPSSAIELHRGLGVNCLHFGEKPELDPPAAYLDRLQAAGMMGLVNAEQATPELLRHPAALAWTVEHEPDMAQKPAYAPDIADPAAVVWIEGEAADPNTLEASPWLEPERPQLSGRRWLTTQKNGGSARWTFRVPAAGTYRLFVREFTKNWANPTRWRIDGRAAVETPRSLRAEEVVDLGGGQGVGWARYGEVELGAGEHALVFEVVPGRTLGQPEQTPDEGAIFAVDAICLTRAETFPAPAKADPLPARMPDAGREAQARIRAMNPDALTWNVLTAGFFGPYRQIPARHYPEFLRWADIASFDHYPVTGWNRPDRLPEVGRATAALVALARPNQPVWTIVEASDQDLSWTPKETRGPTGPELRAQVWSAIANGARGVGYFTIAFEPFRWNHLADEIRAEMRRTNAELTELAAPIVLGRPGALAVTGAETDDPEAAGVAVHAIRKDHDGRVYVIAVNVTRRPAAPVFRLEGVSARAGYARAWKEDRTVPVSGGMFTDAFEPLAVRVYVLEGAGARR